MVEMLLDHERKILAILSEDSGLLTRDVVRRAGFCMSLNTRSNSAQFRDRLNRMKNVGLVDYLDDQKPVCWKRTKLGSDSLAEAEASHA